MNGHNDVLPGTRTLDRGSTGVDSKVHEKGDKLEYSVWRSDLVRYKTAVKTF